MGTHELSEQRLGAMPACRAGPIVLGCVLAQLNNAASCVMSLSKAAWLHCWLHCRLHKAAL
jgi:hypothetical protein